MRTLLILAVLFTSACRDPNAKPRQTAVPPTAASPPFIVEPLPPQPPAPAADDNAPTGRASRQTPDGGGSPPYDEGESELRFDPSGLPLESTPEHPRGVSPEGDEDQCECHDRAPTGRPPYCFPLTS